MGMTYIGNVFFTWSSKAKAVKLVRAFVGVGASAAASVSSTTGAAAAASVPSTTGAAAVASVPSTTVVTLCPSVVATFVDSADIVTRW
jgi:hypothetical protein